MPISELAVKIPTAPLVSRLSGGTTVVTLWTDHFDGPTMTRYSTFGKRFTNGNIAEKPNLARVQARAQSAHWRRCCCAI